MTIALGIVRAVGGGFISAQLGLGDISGFDIRGMLLAVGEGDLVLFVHGLVTKARAGRSSVADPTGTRPWRKRWKIWPSVNHDGA